MTRLLWIRPAMAEARRVKSGSWKTVACMDILSEDPLFFLLNSYTTGLSPSVMGYLLNALLVPRFGGSVSADEIGLPVALAGAALPCGATAIWEK